MGMMIQSRVVGTTMPVLEFSLQPNDVVISESGRLSWMSPNVLMRTSTSAGQQGGIGGFLKRAVGGGSFFMSEYVSQGGTGLLAFAATMPGQIVPVQIQPGMFYMTHRHGFLCATSGVQLSVGFQQSLGAGIFGGDGFVLQRIEGQGLAWTELAGEIVTYDLAPGQTMLAHPGHVGMFEGRVTFGVTTVKGIKNKLFGGDGMFLAALTGPGRIWLQSMPMATLANALIPYLPAPPTEPDQSRGLSFGGDDSSGSW